MTQKINSTAIDALNQIVKALGKLDDDSRRRVLEAASTFFGSQESTVRPSVTSNETVVAPSARPNFSDETAPSPKEFLLDKQPATDVERIACLAYYSTHYRQLTNFKTLDLAKLNTEAAQPKFSNIAFSASNAAKRGYLAPAEKGHRQLSAAGEQFVRLLPDREAARQAMALARPNRNRRARRRTPTDKQAES